MDSWQTVAVVLVGIVAPALVQIIRKYLHVEDTLAQILTLAVSFALAVLVGAVTGELEWNGDLVGTMTMVFTIATFMYKKLQEQFDEKFQIKVS